MITKIYRIIDPFTSEVKYVGKTIQDIFIRLNHHISKAKLRPNLSKKNEWIVSVLEKGGRPIIELIEECEGDSWIEREKYWISYYDNLLNRTSGGEDFIIKQGNIPWNKGGGKYTPETIEKMKNAKKLHPHSEKGKKAISESNKRRWADGSAYETLCSEESRKKVAEALSISVVEYDLNGNFVKEWKSLTEAGEAYGAKASCVSAVCTLKNKSLKGRIFRYLTENYPLKIEVDLDLITKTVQMLDSEMNVIKTFKNIREAANWVFENLNTEKNKLNSINGLKGILREKIKNQVFYRGYYWKWGKHPKKNKIN